MTAREIEGGTAVGASEISSQKLIFLARKLLFYDKYFQDKQSRDYKPTGRLLHGVSAKINYWSQLQIFGYLGKEERK
jgi:hypothetical protein